MCNWGPNGERGTPDTHHIDRKRTHTAVGRTSFFVRYAAGVDEMVREVKDRSQVEEKHAEIENDRRDLENLVAKGGPPYAVQSKQNELDEKTKETVRMRSRRY